MPKWEEAPIVGPAPPKWSAAPVMQTQTEPEPGFMESAGKTAADVGLGLAQGATAGYSDELAAWAGEKAGLGTYDELIGKIRARQKEVPTAIGLPSEIVGGLLGPGKVVKPIAAGVRAIAPTVSRVAAQAPGWLKAVGAGAGYGGAYGSGMAEGGEDGRLAGAATGAGAGAAFGGVAYPVVRGVQKGASAGAQWWRQRASPEAAAQRAVAKAIAQDQRTPAQVGARLSNLGPQAILADAAGANVVGLARGAAGMPGVAKNRAITTLEARAGGEQERIGKALGKLKPKDYFAAEDEFIANLKTRAAPWYDEAYSTYQSVMTPDINRVLATPAGRKALGRAAEKMQNDMTLVGRPDPELTAAAREAAELGLMDPVKGGVAKGLKLRTLDYVKRSLDDMIGGAQRAGERDEARILVGLKEKLVSSVDEATGGAKSPYAKARAIYSDDATVLGALEKGRDFLKSDREIIRREMAKMSDDAKEAYRSGAVRALMDRVQGTADRASAARRIFGNTLIRGKIRELFPDERAFNEFRRTMVAEAQFAETRAAIGSGSRTAPMEQEIEGVRKAGGRLAAILASALPIGGHEMVKAGAARQWAQEALLGRPEAYNEALARLLFSRNQAANQGTIDALRRLNMPPTAQPRPFGPGTRGMLLGSGIVGAETGGLLSGRR